MTDLLSQPPGYHGQLSLEDAAHRHATDDFDAGRSTMTEDPSWYEFPEAYRRAYEARWQHLTMGPEDY